MADLPAADGVGRQCIGASLDYGSRRVERLGPRFRIIHCGEEVDL